MKAAPTVEKDSLFSLVDRSQMPTPTVTRPQESPWRDRLRRLFNNKLALLGLSLLIII
ncbi:ABC transporter permease, partial [Salinicoccus roseus]